MERSRSPLRATGRVLPGQVGGRSKCALTSAGFDFCPENGMALATSGSRDSGLSAYAPIVTASATFLGVNVPVYRDGVVRRRTKDAGSAFVGWVGTVSVPPNPAAAGVAEPPGMTVSMHFRQTARTWSSGAARSPDDTQTLTIDLHNGWTVQTLGRS